MTSSETEERWSGNVAAMREALEEIVSEARCADKELEGEFGSMTDPWSYVASMADIARDALSAPPRNCDIYDSENGVAECMQAIDAAWHEIDTIRATIGWMLATAEGKETPNG